MAILAVGSVAFDSIKTPFGKAEMVLGGSASYFSVAASYFAEVRIVAVVGEDFTDKHLELFASKGIDLRGLERVPGKTFFWAGEYDYDLNNRRTLQTDLNVFADFRPRIIEPYRNSKYVFLGNIDPVIQLEVLRQVNRPELVACDTMNYWIERKFRELAETLRHVDVLIINEAETRELAREYNLLKAARRICEMGPRTLVVKRGEYGVLVFDRAWRFSAPAFPLEEVFDPTGAGDAFAGGFMGYLTSVASRDEESLKRAAIFGSVMASFAVEEFGLKRLASLTMPEIAERYREFKRLTHFGDIEALT